MNRLTERRNGKLTLTKQFPTLQDTLDIIIERLEIYEDLEESLINKKIRLVIKYKAPYELIKGYETDSGYDVRLDTKSLFIKPFETVKLPTGVYLDLPSNYETQVRPKSGLSSKGLLIHFGTVDSDYRGEVLVIATNLTNEPFALRADEKIAQLVFVKKDIVRLEQVEEISNDTSRGTGGFGSTGRF